MPEDVQEWYEPHVAQELGRIRDEIPKYDEHVQPLLKAVFSSIIIKSSYRKSDTSNKREYITDHQEQPGYFISQKGTRTRSNARNNARRRSSICFDWEMRG